MSAFPMYSLEGESMGICFDMLMLIIVWSILKTYQCIIFPNFILILYPTL